MRLAYLVSQYPALNHTFILREIRSLRSQGFDIHVVSIRPSDRDAAAITADEREELARTRAVKDVRIPAVLAALVAELFRRPIGWLRGFALALCLGRGSVPATLAHLFYFAEAVIAGRWMIEAGCAHFHTHFSSTVGLLATRVFPLTMSVTIHGPEEFNSMAAFHMAEKVAASRLVVAISSYARSQILRTCPPAEWEKVVVLRLGVDAAVFDPRPEPTGGVQEILCVGRIAPAKAQYVLIEALALLRKRGVEARLRLVGDGPDRPMLEASAVLLGVKDAVIFDGWRNQDEVRARYRQATVFAMASFAEGIPVVLMEAMAMEIPCVATRIMGIPELIEDGICGLLTAPADAVPLADAIERLLRDATLRRKLGAAGRLRVLEHFDLSKNAARLGELFREWL